MSLHEELRGYVATHPDEDNWTLARGFMRSHTKTSLVPLLAEEFGHVRRIATRAAEVAALARSTPRREPITAEDVRDHLGDLRPLLDEPYPLGDGVRRRGGALTVDDWRVRRAMLASQANGIARSMEVCDRAIAVLTETGARCLDDLDDLAEAA